MTDESIDKSFHEWAATNDTPLWPREAFIAGYKSAMSQFEYVGMTINVREDNKRLALELDEAMQDAARWKRLFESLQKIIDVKDKRLARQQDHLRLA